MRVGLLGGGLPCGNAVSGSHMTQCEPDSPQSCPPLEYFSVGEEAHLPRTPWNLRRAPGDDAVTSHGLWIDTVRALTAVAYFCPFDAILFRLRASWSLGFVCLASASDSLQPQPPSGRIPRPPSCFTAEQRGVTACKAVCQVSNRDIVGYLPTLAHRD